MSKVSEGVSKSWKNLEVAAARNKKDAVELDGVYFSSTWQAWKTTKYHKSIPRESTSISRCIAFRGRLKSAGELNEFGHHWKIVSRQGQDRKIPSHLEAPTGDPAEYEDHATTLLKDYAEALILHPPAGERMPRKTVNAQASFVRDPKVRAYVMLQAKGRCECCGQLAPFETSSGPFLEVHHLVTLADGGPDTIDNTVAVCPNCHRALHLSRDQDARKGMCYLNIPRLKMIT